MKFSQQQSVSKQQQLRAAQSRKWGGKSSETSLAVLLSVLAHAVVAVILAFFVVADQFSEDLSLLVDASSEVGEVSPFAPAIDTSLPEELVANTITDVFQVTSVSGGGLGVDSALIGPGGGSGGGNGDGEGDGVGSGIGAAIDKAVQSRGGATNRALRLSLIWPNMNDLDLHLETTLKLESGIRKEHVYYESPDSPSGFALDVDSNVEPRHNPGVENIDFGGSVPPDGHYTFSVRYFCRHDGQPFSTKFTCYFVCGKAERLIVGSLRRENQLVDFLSFDIKNGEVINLKQPKTVREGKSTDVAFMEGVLTGEEEPVTAKKSKVPPKPLVKKGPANAERLLSQAEQLLNDADTSTATIASQKRDQAFQLLKGITEQYPDSPTAESARALSKRRLQFEID